MTWAKMIQEVHLYESIRFSFTFDLWRWTTMVLGGTKTSAISTPADSEYHLLARCQAGRGGPQRGAEGAVSGWMVGWGGGSWGVSPLPETKF